MSTQLRLAGVVNESIVDGPGIRLVVFTQGCKHHCEGCHNPDTHAFDGGYAETVDAILELIKKNPLLDGVTFSGGEPFEQPEALAELAARIKEMNLSLMIYTGYQFELLSQDEKKAKLLAYADILVDGRFEKSQKSYQLKYIGSFNQRIINVQESLQQKKLCLLEL